MQARYAFDATPTKQRSHAMAASDGAFDHANELVGATVDTTGLAPARHIVLVQAKDASGAWGPTTAVFLTVT